MRPEGSEIAISGLALVSLAAAVALAVYFLARRPSRADVAYVAGAIVQADAAAFYRRYLRRLLRYRGAGGLVGV
ncbi:MAG: hypothetical protein LBD90_01750, partial [Bifidobacteriaceae bacterium]|nr:hypothetical protein [Bifidobacteriaceae bacterium]